MSLHEELGLVDLVGVAHYENTTSGIPQLCIPPITLQDGPDGLANQDTGVTQLPSSLAVAATFDPADAYAEGAVEGDEARRQGIDVVQGPMLNLDRVPEDGRAYETYGEDPVLAGQMGAADVEGIQDAGVMAEAKHFAAYAQESDRHGLDQVLTTRQLEELYFVPFREAVQGADVASVMCAYGEIDRQPACASPFLYDTLRSWGFDGFVRSDMSAVHKAVPAFDAGMDVIKPAEPKAIDEAISDHRLAEWRLDEAVESLLREMFRFDLVAHPLTGHTDTPVTSPAHAAVSLSIAEASTVLLKNEGKVLPLDTARLRSLAVLGGDAAGDAATAGYGGARVVAPFVVEPVRVLAALLGHGRVRYASGGTGIEDPARLHSPGLELGPAVALPGTAGHAYDPRGSDASPADGETDPLVPADGERALYRMTGTFEPPATGWYDVSLEDDCATWLLLDGRVLLDSAARHQAFTWSTAVQLDAGHRYQLELLFRQVHGGDVPRVGLSDVNPELTAAVRLARSSQVAVVFASDYSSEGMDRPDLSLPGDENELISAVADANRRTIVVLDTAGPVLMPWLGKVAAVLEAWYPGEEDGNAIASVLTGRYDPSGRLPVTFPASQLAVPAHTLATWPGIDSTVQFGEGLDIGYRWDQANHVRPLFPFGYGLSYTTFELSDLSVRDDWDGGVSLSLHVQNSGPVRGSEVVQAYVGFPPVAAEPPWQLKAFARVDLASHASTSVTLELPRSSFECWHDGAWRTVPGRYAVGVGASSADLPLTVSLAVHR